MNNIRILTYLLDNKSKQFTINQIAKDLSLNYRIAHTEVKKLANKGIISCTPVGKALLCSLSGKFDKEIYLAEYERQKILEKDMLKIKSRFEKAKQSFILLLFGSVAKKMQSEFSDIDLLAISENKKELENIADLIPKNIHLSVISYELFIKMAKSKEVSVVSEAINNNVIVIGIEEYYRLLENAK